MGTGDGCERTSLLCGQNQLHGHASFRHWQSLSCSISSTSFM